jgi:hypothetical protein
MREPGSTARAGLEGLLGAALQGASGLAAAAARTKGLFSMMDMDKLQQQGGEKRADAAPPPQRPPERATQPERERLPPPPPPAPAAPARAPVAAPESAAAAAARAAEAMLMRDLLDAGIEPSRTTTVEGEHAVLDMGTAPPWTSRAPGGIVRSAGADAPPGGDGMRASDIFAGLPGQGAASDFVGVLGRAARGVAQSAAAAAGQIAAVAGTGTGPLQGFGGLPTTFTLPTAASQSGAAVVQNDARGGTSRSAGDARIADVLKGYGGGGMGGGGSSPTGVTTMRSGGPGLNPARLGSEGGDSSWALACMHAAGSLSRRQAAFAFAVLVALVAAYLVMTAEEEAGILTTTPP